MFRSLLAHLLDAPMDEEDHPSHSDATGPGGLPLLLAPGEPCSRLPNFFFRRQDLCRPNDRVQDHLLDIRVRQEGQGARGAAFRSHRCTDPSGWPFAQLKTGRAHGRFLRIRCMSMSYAGREVRAVVAERLMYKDFSAKESVRRGRTSRNFVGRCELLSPRGGSRESKVLQSTST